MTSQTSYFHRALNPGSASRDELIEFAEETLDAEPVNAPDADKDLFTAERIDFLTGEPFDE